MKEISAGVLLPIDGTKRKFGASVLQLIEDCCPELRPVKCGSYEPLRFDCSSLAASEVAQKYWAEDYFFWKCRRRGFEGGCCKARVLMHCSLNISGPSNSELFDKLTTLFEKISGEYPIDFAWIHTLGESEFNSIELNASHRLWAPFNSGVTSHGLINSGVPNLAWLTIFGEPYLQYVNEEHFASCERVWQPNNDASAPLFVQLTDSPCDPVEKYEEFDALRTKVKSGIPHDIFCSAESDATVRPEFSRKDGSRLPL